MLKINLLEGKEVPFVEERPEIKESEFLSVEDFVPPEEEKIERAEPEPAEKQDQDKAQVESPSEKPEPLVAEKKPVKEATEIEEFSFNKKSRFPIVSTVVLLVIALLVFAYFRFFSNKKGAPVPAKVAVEDTTQKAVKPAVQEGVSAKKTPPETAKVKTAPAAVSQGGTPSAGLANEKKAGFAAVNLFGKVLDAVPSGAKIAFLSFTSGYFNIELYARQNETINTFLQQAKASVPSFSYKIVSKDRALLDGIKMNHVILSGKISLSGGAATSGSILEAKKAKAAILNLSRTDHVRLREVRKSPLVTDEKGKHIPITVKISASGENTQKFLTDLLNAYRNLGVSRILISASRTKGGHQQDAALDLNLFLE